MQLGRHRIWLLAVLFLAALPAVACEEDPYQAKPTPAPESPTATSGTGEWPPDGLATFADFPVLWLGDSFAGLDRGRISREHYFPLPPVPPSTGQNGIHIIYGSCAPAPCAIPGSVHIRHICSLPPSFFPPPKEVVRGDALVQYGRSGGGDPEGFMLWTGRSTIQVRLPGGTGALDAALAALHSPGVSPAIAPGDPLPAPDETGCELSVWDERVTRHNRSGIPAPDEPVPVPAQSAAWTGFTQDSIALPEIGDSATATIAVRDLPAGVSGVHLAIAHSDSIRITAARCAGLFAAGRPLWAAGSQDPRDSGVSRFPADGVSMVGCFVGRGTPESNSEDVMTVTVERVGDGPATLTLRSDIPLVTRYFANGFAVGAGELGSLEITAD